MMIMIAKIVKFLKETIEDNKTMETDQLKDQLVVYIHLEDVVVEDEVELCRLSNRIFLKNSFGYNKFDNLRIKRICISNRIYFLNSINEFCFLKFENKMTGYGNSFYFK